MKIVPVYNPYGAAYQTPDTIIVHAMGEYIQVGESDYEHAPDYLMRQGLSAHAMAAPDGTIYRCRPDSLGAYHAREHNTDSLGIEVMVSGKHDYNSFARAIGTHYLTDAQYDAVVWQCKEWMQKHKITKILRHSDVSPGRKIDPGDGFPWDKFLEDVKTEAA